jgi:hypothetical protein
MYADEDRGILASNDWTFRASLVVVSTSNSWVTGNAGLDTNTESISDGSIFPYVKNLNCYHCPSDLSLILGTSLPTLRTYSLSCFLGGPLADAVKFGVKSLQRTSQILKPAQTLTFIDEDDSSIDDGHFLYSSTVNAWFNLPAWRHAHGDTLAFADGHDEYWKWRSAHPADSFLDSGVPITDPLALQDIAKLHATAP